MTPEETYLTHLRTIERIAAFVARRNRLNRDECAEFVQEVRVRLLDDDYSVIRKFEGRSSFSTFLTTVIVRLFHQWRVEQWGKWRPSAEAKRLGDTAITLERLLSRDGYTFAEAVNVLTTQEGSRHNVAELESIHLRLPLRTPRPVMTSDAVASEMIGVEPDAEVELESRDRREAARRAARSMDELLESMPAEDRLILQMRFWHALKVPEIARTLHVDQKKLYKRLDKLFLHLRRGLETAGLTRSDVAGLLQHGDQDIRLEAMDGAEFQSAGPSHVRGAEELRGPEGSAR
jgi:RNA polymerase sigma factor (sigma-70 family)